MRKVQLYATGAATATSVAQVTIPVATTIKGMYVSILVDTIVDNSSVRLEISKVPTNQIGVNGAFDPEWEGGLFTNLLTSGLSQQSLVTFVPMSISCRAGEILYLHATVVSATYFANFLLVY